MPPRSSHSSYTARRPRFRGSPSRSSAHSSGYSPTSRWPAAGTTRSGARSRARVLEPVLERDQPVAGAPDDERRAADPVEVRARIVAAERSGRALDVLVLGLRLEEPGHGLRRERARLLGAPEAEDAGTEVRPARDRRHAPWPTSRPGRRVPDDVEPDPRAPGQRDDPGGRDQRERRDRLRPLRREAKGDDAAQRVADDGRRAASPRARRPPATWRGQVAQALAPRAAARCRRGPEGPGSARGGRRARSGASSGEVVRRARRARARGRAAGRPLRPSSGCGCRRSPQRATRTLEEALPRPRPATVSCEHVRGRSTRPLSFVARNPSPRALPARALPAGFFVR